MGKYPNRTITQTRQKCERTVTQMRLLLSALYSYDMEITLYPSHSDVDKFQYVMC